MQGRRRGANKKNREIIRIWYICCKSNALYDYIISLLNIGHYRGHTIEISVMISKYFDNALILYAVDKKIKIK
jgi:hypothetical protein